MTEIYHQLTEASTRHNEKNDCAVKAVCVVTGCDYDTAHRMLLAEGRKRRRGTPMPCTIKVICKLGYGICNMTKQFRSRTVRTLEEELGSGVYLIQTSGHILGYRDGKIHDWTKGRKHRITSIHKIVKVKGSNHG